MPNVTAVEGDTALTLTFALTDARRAINLQAASSVVLHLNGSTASVTPIATPGYATVVVPAAMLDTQGHFHAELAVTIDGNEQRFPSEAPIFVEVLPHTRSRS